MSPPAEGGTASPRSLVLFLIFSIGVWSSRSYRSFYKNNGDGPFTDVTDGVGLGAINNNRAAGWGDFDNDGYLDLYVGSMGHYLGQQSVPLHFGLGKVTVVDQVVVTWPSGMVQTLVNVPADQQLLVTEGE